MAGRSQSFTSVVFLLRKHTSLIDLSSPRNLITDVHVIKLPHAPAIKAAQAVGGLPGRLNWEHLLLVKSQRTGRWMRMELDPDDSGSINKDIGFVKWT